ncbi:LuxR C-terminal-related transcriptional regulator [Streptomyces sp. 11x1]|uniref:helix-turn-helix transcriptional regulator n=1 Tax=Streptomyces sp. 11x1 TaxID=3038642 RepID=UPI00292EFF48|nr:LuxR C-terminal-related transcriptional regulator [Streptomyces sp. 11x1]WNZ09764.1 LuxR C-terminal-related transcriptional regulator [Streptomyces sp. 11x1]
MSTATHTEHGAEKLCAKGAELYERALREGHVRSEDAAETPCLLAFGLLRPATDGPGRLEPVSPVAALHRLLRGIEDRISRERHREEQLTAMFEPLMRVDTRHTGIVDNSAIAFLSGSEQINEAITAAVADASRELLCIQPHVRYHHQQNRHVALDRDQAVLDRGVRIRTLYQHTLRHAPMVLARYEQLKGDTEARTLDEITDRLIVVDGEVAFISGDKAGSTALAVRQPALVGYFATFFDRLWRLATPMYPDAVQPPTIHGITPRQRAIAALLTEGHTDTAIADRLGMNVRTARVHIAKLAATLGSESRAQLGYLIGRSGILEREPKLRP